MDLKKSIRLAVDSGKVTLGAQKNIKQILNGELKLVVVAGNCPAETGKDVQRFCELAKIPVVKFDGSSVELGTVCGKPFPVSVLGVADAGDSDILKSA